MSMKHEMHSNSDIASLSTRAGQTLTREILCSVTKLTTLYFVLEMCTNIVFWSIWRGESRSFPQAKPIKIVATLVVVGFLFHAPDATSTMLTCSHGTVPN